VGLQSVVRAGRQQHKQLPLQIPCSSNTSSALCTPSAQQHTQPAHLVPFAVASSDRLLASVRRVGLPPAPGCMRHRAAQAQECGGCAGVGWLRAPRGGWVFACAGQHKDRCTNTHRGTRWRSCARNQRAGHLNTAHRVRTLSAPAS